LATGSADKTVRLWDSSKLAATRTLSGLTDYVFALAFSPDGKRVAAGAYNGEVRIWTVADGKEQAAFNASPGFSAQKVNAQVK
jgi:WD40 repeat protein